MDKRVRKKLDEAVREHSSRKRWKSVVSALCAAVVLITSYVLINPAVTQKSATYCGMEEHTHTEECYSDGELVCALPVHEHGLTCFSDPEADRETADIWEKAFDGLNLTGNWNRDIVSVAETQVGYSESSANYDVAEDGETLMGYTRYGDWYGDAYCDWSTVFVSFCLHYAGVPESTVPAAEDAASMIDSLERAGLFKGIGYPAKKGDLVFFDTDGTGSADRTGIVSSVSGDVICTVEGDVSGRVEPCTYGRFSDSVKGYGSLADVSYGVGERTISASAGDGAEVTLSGRLPESALASIAPVSLTDSQIAACYGDDDGGEKNYAAYDISVLVDGEEWEPDDTVSVTVSRPAVDRSGLGALSVIHLDDADCADEVPSSVDKEGNVSFETNGFSVFVVTVDFHYESYTFSIRGQSSILLSDLFEELGTGRSVSDVVPDGVTFTDPSLVSVESAEGGDYLLTSIQPFETEERLTVNFTDGTVFEITVTDAMSDYNTTPSNGKFKVIVHVYDVDHPDRPLPYVDVRINKFNKGGNRVEELLQMTSDKDGVAFVQVPINSNGTITDNGGVIHNGNVNIVSDYTDNRNRFDLDTPANSGFGLVTAPSTGAHIRNFLGGHWASKIQLSANGNPYDDFKLDGNLNAWLNGTANATGGIRVEYDLYLRDLNSSASSYTISFDTSTMSNGSLFTPLTVSKDSYYTGTVPTPESPNQNLVFGGWKCGNADFSFDDHCVVNHNITLTPKWVTAGAQGVIHFKVYFWDHENYWTQSGGTPNSGQTKIPIDGLQFELKSYPGTGFSGADADKISVGRANQTLGEFDSVTVHYDFNTGTFSGDYLIDSSQLQFLRDGWIIDADPVNTGTAYYDRGVTDPNYTSPYNPSWPADASNATGYHVYTGDTQYGPEQTSFDWDWVTAHDVHNQGSGLVGVRVIPTAQKHGGTLPNGTNLNDVALIDQNMIDNGFEFTFYCYVVPACVVDFDCDGGNPATYPRQRFNPVDSYQQHVGHYLATDPGHPTKTGMQFVGWYEVIGKDPDTNEDILASTPWDFDRVVTHSMVLKAVYDLNPVNVYWVDYDWNGNLGTYLEKDVCRAGDTPYFDSEFPSRAPTPQYTYEFAGWEQIDENRQIIATVPGPDLREGNTVRTGDQIHIYRAKYTATPRTYTVKWVDADWVDTAPDDPGTVLETDSGVAYNSVAHYDGPVPTKAADAQYTYTFTGWQLISPTSSGPYANPNGTNVTSDQIYRALYAATPVNYTVIWKNDDLSVLDTETTYHYGDLPTYKHGTPVSSQTAGINQYYQFTGWAPTVSAVTGDAVYVAQYSLISTPRSVTVSKTLTGTSENISFPFEMTVTDSSNSPVDMTGVSLPAGASIKQGTRNVILFSLTGGQNTVVTGIPWGSNVVVKETSASGYTVAPVGTNGSDTGNATFTFSNLIQDGTVNFVNDLEREDLTVVKTVTNEPGSTASFPFSVTVTGTNLDLSMIAGNAGVTVNGNVITFNLSNSQSKTVTLPAGCAVTVTETAHAGYNTSNRIGSASQDSDTRTIPSLDSATSVVFTNDKIRTVDITVRKNLNGGGSGSFDFTLEVDHPDWDPDVSASGWPSGATVDSNGKVSFTLTVTSGNTPSITIPTVPIGANVTVTETQHNGYYVVVKDGNVTLGGDSGTLQNVGTSKTLDVYNTPGEPLPMTGGPGTALIYTLGAILTVCPLMCVYILRRRRERRIE